MNNKAIDNILICLVAYALLCMISTYWIGMTGIMILGSGVVIGSAIGIVYNLYIPLKQKWSEFEYENPTEDVLIIRKLKGTDTIRDS